MKKFTVILAAIMLPSFSFAQDEDRRWALEGNIGPTFIKDKTNISGPGAKNGHATYFGAEYYIPDTHFSARVGYQSESLFLGTDLITAEQNTVNLGGKWYPGAAYWKVQPHLGLSTHILVSQDNSVEGWQGINGEQTSYVADIHSPRFALSPSLGVDLYFLTSVALTADFSYSIGINGRYDFDYSNNNNKPIHVHGNLNHANLQLGLKITFPFRFTRADGSSLPDGLFELLLPR